MRSMFRVYISIVIFIITSIAKQSLCGKCPEPEILHPCTCSQEIDRISCIKFNENDFNSSYTLPQIFESLSESLENNNEKGFQELLLANTKVTELGANTFLDITFEKIEIYENNLTRINSTTFQNSYSAVKEVYMNCLALRNIQQNDSFFDALSSLLNLEKLTLDLGLDSIVRIPDNAFNSINGIQSKLQEINLVGVIASVGQNAFKELPNLRKLKVADQIDYVSALAFDFSKLSNDGLELNLANNKLIGSSFEADAFSKASRPIYLNLGNNNIKYLDKSVFESFLKLDPSNNISIWRNTLDCDDCRSYWLIQQKELINGQIKDAICQNGQSIWDYHWSCESDSDSTTISISTILAFICIIRILFI